MSALNTVCDAHGHDTGLPDRELRGHVLTRALQAAEAVLAAHGYPDVARSLEVLHVAVEDALDLDDQPARAH